MKNLSGKKTKNKEMTKSAKMNNNKPENTDRLSRQQWKNKMKNKRKCQNKYRQNKPAEEVNQVQSAEKHKPGEEVKTESHSNNNNSDDPPAKRQEKECKQGKMKRTVEQTEPSCPTKTETHRGGKQTQRKRNKTGDVEVEKVSSLSPAEGSEQKAVEVTDDQHQLPAKRPKPEPSQKQSLNKEKLRKILQSQEPEQQESSAETKDEPSFPKEEAQPDRSASLRSRMEQRLESARFRYINEVLYSTSSGEASRMFKQDPQAFWIYHKGYTAQVQRWPANPVDEIISFIRRK